MNIVRLRKQGNIPAAQPPIIENGTGLGNIPSATNGAFPGRETLVRDLRNLVLHEWEQFSQSVNKEAFPSKEDLRHKHSANRLEILERDRTWIALKACELLGWFACGSEVVPAEISPRLVQVHNDERRDRFRLARYAPALPVPGLALCPGHR